MTIIIYICGVQPDILIYVYIFKQIHLYLAFELCISYFFKYQFKSLWVQHEK